MGLDAGARYTGGRKRPVAPHRAFASPPAPLEDVHDPETDGKPVAETDIHIDCLLSTREVLRQYFRTKDPLVYVAGNLFVYYERGNPKRRVAPDVFVVRGVPAGPRRVYKGIGRGVRLGLGAGGHLPQHAARGYGHQARHLRGAGGTRILPVRSSW